MRFQRQGTAPPPMKLPPPYSAPSEDSEESEGEHAFTDGESRSLFRVDAEFIQLCFNDCCTSLTPGLWVI